MKREVQYVLMDPTGNMTVLVETMVPAEAQPAVAAKIMALEPQAEQVGFLSEASSCDIALRMAGGEFCGNAAMSAAVRLGMRRGVREGQFSVQVSGVPAPVAVRIREDGNRSFLGYVEMPRPLSVEHVSFSDGTAYPVVTFPGISHVILEEMLPREEAERRAKRWCAELQTDALGVMFLDRKRSTLVPLVYVPGADTLFWENACGSGTSAVGAWLAVQKNRTVTVSLKQPGGTLTVIASPEADITLQGTVFCVYENTVMIHI